MTDETAVDEGMGEIEALRDRLALIESARERDTCYREALRQLRRMVTLIKHGDTPEEIVEALGECLSTAQIDYAGYGVNLIEEDSGEIQLTQHTHEPDGGVFHRVSILRAPDIVTTWWREGRTVYRKDLLNDDPYDELKDLATTEPAQRRSVIDIPFSGGTLGVNSLRADAFTDTDLEFLQDLAGLLTAATQRWHDLRQFKHATPSYPNSWPKTTNARSRWGESTTPWQRRSVCWRHSTRPERLCWGPSTWRTSSTRCPCK